MSTVTVPDELAQRYAKLAEETGRTQTFYITEALEEAIDQLEFEYKILKKSQDWRAGKLKTIILDELKESLELENRN